MTLTNETLQAKINQAKEEAKAKAQQSIIEARMSLLDNLEYLETLASIEVTSIKTSIMENHINTCEQIIIEQPVYNRATREERKWSGRYVFEFGNDIQLLYRLCTGILYAAKEHKYLMLDITGLNTVAIETFVSAMGSPSYYSTQYKVVVEATPFNATLAKAYATVLGGQLGIVLDTSSLTESVFTKYFNRELERAELLKQEADLAPDSPFTMS